jgi:hypothetical protein
MPSSDDIYTAPVAEFTDEVVLQFVLDAEAAILFSESLTFEARNVGTASTSPRQWPRRATPTAA